LFFTFFSSEWKKEEKSTGGEEGAFFCVGGCERKFKEGKGKEGFGFVFLLAEGGKKGESSTLRELYCLLLSFEGERRWEKKGGAGASGRNFADQGERKREEGRESSFLFARS